MLVCVCVEHRGGVRDGHTELLSRRALRAAAGIRFTDNLTRGVLAEPAIPRTGRDEGWVGGREGWRGREEEGRGNGRWQVVVSGLGWWEVCGMR